MITALGIDAGFAFVGWSLMAVGDAAEDDCVIDANVFETKKSNKKQKVLVASDDQRRSREIARFFADKIEMNTVRILCLEAKSLPRNAATSSKLGHCFGILSTLAEVFDIPIASVSPQELKKHLTGRIKVTDEELNEAIAKRYGEAEYFLSKIARSKRQHAYDAIGAIDTCKKGETFRAIRSAVRCQSEERTS